MIIGSHGSLVHGTCEWIKEVEAFKTWVLHGNKLLYIIGDAGTGKTFLSIFLVKYLRSLQLSQSPSLQSGKSLLLAFFCNYATAERRSSASIIGSLLSQLLEADDSLYKVILPAFQTCEERNEDLFDDAKQANVWKLFTELLNRTERPVYIVLDGLDECDTDSVSFLQRQFQDLHFSTSDHANHQVSSVLIGRPLSGRNSSALLIDLNGHLPGRSTDITLFARERLLSHALLDGADDHKHEIVTIFVERAEGRYLWLSLVFNMIKDDPALQQALSRNAQSVSSIFPQGLSSVYNRILGRIHKQNRADVRNGLLCICSAYCPLSAGEITALTGVRILSRTGSLLPEWTNLVSVDEQTHICTLIHFWLQEHLERLGDMSIHPLSMVLLSGLGVVKKMSSLLSWQLSLPLALGVAITAALVGMATIIGGIWSSTPYSSASILIFMGLMLTLVDQNRMLQGRLIRCIEQTIELRQSPYFGITKAEGHTILSHAVVRLLSDCFRNEQLDWTEVPYGPIKESVDLRTKDLKSSLCKKVMSSEVRYCCHHWVDHFLASDISNIELDAIERFLGDWSLHWLQCAGMLDAMQEACEGLAILLYGCPKFV